MANCLGPSFAASRPCTCIVAAALASSVRFSWLWRFLTANAGLCLAGGSALLHVSFAGCPETVRRKWLRYREPQGQTWRVQKCCRSSRHAPLSLGSTNGSMGSKGSFVSHATLAACVHCFKFFLLCRSYARMFVLTTCLPSVNQVLRAKNPDKSTLCTVDCIGLYVRAT